MSASSSSSSSIYDSKPWLAQLSDIQRAPATPPETVLHAFRDAVRRAPDRTALAYFDGRLSYREADELSPTGSRATS
jgi:long-chain acyl-CoA synthetase